MTHFFTGPKIESKISHAPVTSIVIDEQAMKPHSKLYADTVFGKMLNLVDKV